QLLELGGPRRGGAGTHGPGGKPAARTGGDAAAPRLVVAALRLPPLPGGRAGGRPDAAAGRYGTGADPRPAQRWPDRRLLPDLRAAGRRPAPRGPDGTDRPAGG